MDDVIELGDGGGAGNLIISKVVQIHIDNKYLDANGNLDTKKLDLVARLGGSWYSRVKEDSLFEIPKPIATKGIGVDQLPTHIFATEVLSNNNIGRLGNVEKIPSKEEIEAFISNSEISIILKITDIKIRLIELHKLIKKHLENDEINLASKAVFSIV